ncbi:MAG TPA: hypothetical protein VGK94_06760 [Candidatus Polarisedimenticolia bacterium]
MTCEQARLGFADVTAGGPADAAVVEHLRICAACAEELRVFRAVLEEASRCAGADIPDPGEAYWDRFLPSVRERVALHRTTADRSRASLRAVAAATLLMVAGSVGALLLSPESAHHGDPLLAAGHRLDEALERMPGLLPEVAGDMLGTDPIGDVTDRQILDSIEEIEPPRGFAQEWSSDDVERMLGQLTAEQVARLKADLATDLG